MTTPTPIGHIQGHIQGHGQGHIVGGQGHTAAIHLGADLGHILEEDLGRDIGHTQGRIREVGHGVQDLGHIPTQGREVGREVGHHHLGDRTLKGQICPEINRTQRKDLYLVLKKWTEKLTLVL